MDLETNTKDFTNDGTMDLRGRPVIASKTGKWKACAFLLTYEACERMAFYGIASNLVVYLTTQLHEDTISSVRNVNNWNGVVWMTPILGAYIADAYLGRFWTFTISSLIYVLGMVLLTMVVSIKSFKPTCINGTCNTSSSLPVVLFYTSLYIIAIGAGGTKPNISTFGADQFDDFDPCEKELKVSFFNWWMFCAFLGGLFATLGLVYIQENLGWGLGYGIPTIALILSLMVFYFGTPTYRHKPKNIKSPAADIVKVVINSMANWNLKVPAKSNQEVQPPYYITDGKTLENGPSIFRGVVQSAINKEPRMGASLLRLHFHDCFVHGCDASNLLDDSPSFKSEKGAAPNRNSARGFEVIDQIKSAVEKVCPGVVSCADILAITARDSVAILGGPNWDVKLGRRDSLTAYFAEANATNTIPAANASLSNLISSFQNHGLSTRDLVALYGAHTIGEARCTNFRQHIYQDKNIDPSFAKSNQGKCPKNNGNGDNNLAPLDAQSPNKFDNTYFKTLLNRQAILHSDQELYNGGGATDTLVRTYASNPNAFISDFTASIIKMGNINILTGSQGQIRKNCRRVN